MSHLRPLSPRAQHLTVSAALAAVALGACSPPKSADDPRTQAPLVEVAAVAPASPGVDGVTGTLAARVQSSLSYRVSGKIVERLVDTGQTVRRGQPLMRLDASDFEHNAAALAASVAAAKARLVQAAADEARYQDLVASGAVSRSAYDQAKQAADSARALVLAAEAQLKVAQDERAYTTLFADADGVVMETSGEPGQFVAAGQTVLRLGQAGPREAVVNLPEAVRPAIGSQAEAQVYGFPNHASARLRQLSESADPATRTYEARYVLDGPEAHAPLGATVTIYLRSPSMGQEMAVPLGAVEDDGRGAGVWTIGAGSTVSLRRVRVVRLEAERAIVSEGVHIGEAIVALGGHDLREGERVRAVAGAVKP